MISIIVAMDTNRGIGKENSIPWHIPQDFKHFKEITMGHPIIMGRRTFESLGRVLPGRAHIIITHNVENKTEVEGLVWVDSLESAIEVAKKQKGSNEVFVIGGGEIFKEAIEKSLVDKLYLTIIEGDYDADTFFPEYSGFKLVKEENREEVYSTDSGHSGKHKFKFQYLER